MHTPNVGDVHGDLWNERIRHDHERHAGVPDFGYCPGRDATRPWPPMVSAADVDHQRSMLRREALIASHDRLGHDGIGCGCLDALDA